MAHEVDSREVQEVAQKAFRLFVSELTDGRYSNGAPSSYLDRVLQDRKFPSAQIAEALQILTEMIRNNSKWSMRQNSFYSAAYKYFFLSYKQAMRN